MTFRGGCALHGGFERERFVIGGMACRASSAASRLVLSTLSRLPVSACLTQRRRRHPARQAGIRATVTEGKRERGNRNAAP